MVMELIMVIVSKFLKTIDCVIDGDGYINSNLVNYSIEH